MDLKIMTQDNAIFFDLNMTTDVTHLKFDQVFQTEARDNIFLKINEQLLQVDIEQDYDSLFYDRFHNAITISGPRGSGKSTFLRHILTCLSNPERVSASSKQEEEIPKGLEVLRIIDPTLISSKEHVLIILISQVRDAVSKYKKSISDHDFSEYEYCLKELAGGLCQIDGIGPSEYGDEWEDKTYILEKGLEKASAGRNLERNLNKFVESALKAIDKKAFVLTFDDIDTKFEKGWPVLETIRKYLTSPKWIVLISGDIELYARLIRSAQYKSLGDEIMKYERPSLDFHNSNNLNDYREDNIIATVSELQEQYMMKVLKPENQVSMLTLHQKSLRNNDNTTKIFLNNSSKDIQVPLEDVITTFLSKCLGLTQTHEHKRAASGLLGLQTRTFLQLLKSILVDLKLSSSIANNNSGSFEFDKAQLDDFTQRVIGIFNNAFSNYKIRLSDLLVAKYSMVTLAKLFWRWAIEEGVWQNFDSITTSSDEEGFNSRVLTFLTLVSSHTKFDISQSFKWGMFSATPVFLAQNVRSEDPNNRRNREGIKISINEILDYMSLNDTYISICHTTQKALLAYLTQPSNGKATKFTLSNPENLGLYTVPRYNNTSLLFEANLERFYKIQGIQSYKDKITKGTKAQKTAARKNLKEAYHNAVLKLADPKTSYETYGEMADWLSGMAKVYSKLNDKNKMPKVQTVGFIYSTIESIGESYDLGHFINYAKVSVKDFNKGAETNFLSGLSLISCIFELIEKSGGDDEIKSLVLDAAPKTTHLMPSWYNDDSESREDDADADAEEELPTVAENYSGDFYENLIKWIKAVKKYWPKNNLSSASLNNLFNNFLENLDSLERDPAIGCLLHSQIVLFLHYCLIEDLNRNNDLNKINEKVSIKSLADTEKELVENITKYAKYNLFTMGSSNKDALSLHKEMLIEPQESLFGLMLACPIIGLFLRKQPVQTKKKPIKWNWHTAHASCFIKLINTNFCLIENIEENLKNDEYISLIKADNLSQEKRSVIFKTYYSEYTALMIEYLDSIKVTRKIEGENLTFDNLYPVLNTIPITGKSDWQKLGVSLELASEPLTPPPPPPPLPEEGAEENTSDATKEETNGGLESDVKEQLLQNEQEIEAADSESKKPQTQSSSVKPEE